MRSQSIQPSQVLIVLDLGGFTIQPNPNVGSILVAGVAVLANPTASKITIQNGSIYAFWNGIAVNPNTSTQSTIYVANVHIQNINFNYNLFVNVAFNQTNNSSLADCVFLGGTLTGIQDAYSQTGNHFSNISFNIGQNTAIQIIANGSVGGRFKTSQWGSN
jgi:hypothetical protein